MTNYNKRIDATWLAIGAVLMAFTLLYYTLNIDNVKNRVHAEDELANRKQQQALTFVVVVLALVSYLGMLFATLYSTEANVIIIRYVEWFITTPILLIDLALIAMISLKRLNVMIVLDFIMILMGLGAVYAHSNFIKYALFILSFISMTAIFYILHNPSKQTLERQETNESVKKSKAAIEYTTIIWTIYPVIWLLGKNTSNVLSRQNETLSYMVLDVLAKAVFGIIFVF